MTTAVHRILAIPQWSPARPTWSWEWLLVTVILIIWSATVLVDFRIALSILMAIGFGAAVIGLRYPRLGLLGIGMLCTLNEVAGLLVLGGGWFRWNTVSYWLLFVAMVFSPSLLSLSRWQGRLLVALILMLGLEILLSPDMLDGVQHVFAIVAVFGLLVYFRRAVSDLNAWYWLGVVTGVLAAGSCAALLLQQGRLPYVNPNVWSYVPLTAMLAICLAFVVTEAPPRRRFVLALLAVINAVWVFLSGSRGSLLIAVVCLGFLLVAMRLRHTLFVGIVATLVSMLVISQFTTFQQRAIERLRLLADPSQSATERTSGRFDLVVGAWHMFRDHPLGVGTGGFTTTWTELQSREGMTQWHRSRPTPAHSGWMKVLAENGFPGIVLLAGYVVSFAVRGWRARAPHLQRLGLMVTAVLAVAWISSEFQNKAVWFIAAGATVLLDYGSKRGAARSAVNGV